MRANFRVRFFCFLGMMPLCALTCAVLAPALALGAQPTAAEIEAAFKPSAGDAPAAHPGGKPSELGGMEERYALAREVARQEELEFDSKYRAALEQVRAKAKGEGDLDGVLAAEAALVALDNGTELAAAKVPAVANLQQIRAANLPAVRAKTAAGLMKLELVRLKELEALVPQLVKQGDIKQAQRAKELAGQAQKALETLAASPSKPVPAKAPAPSPAAVPQWIWNTPQAKDNTIVFFRRSVEVPPAVREARLALACDDAFELFLDGKPIATGKVWSEPSLLDLTKQLASGGTHVFAVQAANSGGQAGLAFLLELTLASGEKLAVVSDASWKVTDKEKRGWDNPSFSDDTWEKATVVTPMGGSPWGNVFAPKK